jgi:hypothetical protein
MLVIRGLDPRIHHLKKMDCRIKSGNDDERATPEFYTHDHN